MGSIRPPRSVAGSLKGGKMLKKAFICLVMFLIIFIGGEVMALELKSPNFNHNEFIPKEYSCQGENVSPALDWSDVPTDTKSFALICDDPDAPVETWVHWVIYDISAERNDLPVGVVAVDILDDGSKQGINDFGDIGYGGPCPPPGKAHRYFFTLYCLDEVLNLKPGLKKKELLKAMEGHIIQKTELIGLYKR